MFCDKTCPAVPGKQCDHDIRRAYFHLTSFPLFLPAIVQFVNEIMAKGEAVKGQALYTTAITISSVFASILGGIILDMSGPKLMLLVSAVLTAIGALGVLMLVDKVPKHSRTLEK